MNKILEIKNLKKIYHTEEEEILAIEDVSFELYEGEILAIVGPSGCGKSSILSMISKLEDITSGTINFSKEEPVVGYMLQEDSLFPWLNILDNCLIGLRIRKELNDDTKKRVVELLEEYGLKDFMNSYPSNLSGGMRQRVV